MLIQDCLYTRKGLELDPEKRKMRRIFKSHKMNNDMEKVNKKFIFLVSPSTRYKEHQTRQYDHTK